MLPCGLMEVSHHFRVSPISSQWNYKGRKGRKKERKLLSLSSILLCWKLFFSLWLSIFAWPANFLVDLLDVSKWDTGIWSLDEQSWYVIIVPLLCASTEFFADTILLTFVSTENIHTEGILSTFVSADGLQRIHPVEMFVKRKPFAKAVLPTFL